MGERWTGIVPLNDVKVIQRLEEKYGIRTGRLFSNFIETYNGGCVSPHPYIYNPDLQYGVMFSNVLSFNDQDNNNVFDAIEKIVTSDGKLPFIPFGYSKNGVFGINGRRVLIKDSDNGQLVIISNSFGSFVNKIV